MSARNCTSVEIVVSHRGDTNLARAGVGRDAETASSTSSGFFAAISAARKFFGLKSSFALQIKQAGSYTAPTIYLATRGVEMITIEFEDHGQDFLHWTIERGGGQVVECGPFQASIWCESIVLNHAELSVGVRPVIKTKHGDTLTLNYAIETMRKGAS